MEPMLLISNGFSEPEFNFIYCSQDVGYSSVFILPSES